MSMLSDALGGGDVSVDAPDMSDINKRYRGLLNKLGLQKGGDQIPMVQQIMEMLGQWQNYDASQNRVDATGGLTGTGMSGILDALARNSYQQASGAINYQANDSRKGVLDMLTRRGILNSSQAPGALSALEGQRVQSIQQAAGQIEGQRLQGQMSIPQLAMMMGQFAQGEKQRQVGNQYNALGMAGSQVGMLGQLQMQADQIRAQQQAASMQNMTNLGIGIGSLALAPFTGGASLAGLGMMQNTQPTGTPPPPTSSGGATTGIGPWYNQNGLPG